MTIPGFAPLRTALPRLAAAIACAAAPGAALAQTETRVEPQDPPESTVFDGDYLSIGLGGGYGPSYDGSDDYVFFPAPLVQGSLGGIGINPRSAGLALDFVQDPDEGPGFDAGIAARLRRNRANQVEDEVVLAAGKLDSAFEIGPTVGISIPGVLHGFDSLTFSADARWDLAGAHEGMVIDPSIAYFTPLSTGMAASLTLSAEYGDGDYTRYYYSVSAEQSDASGLPTFATDGGGFTKAGISLLLGYDLNGELRDGGFAIFAIGGYSRMLGDAKESPYTSIRGSDSQWFGAAGIGYTF